MTHTAEEVRAFIAHMDATASWLTPGERDIAAAYADLLERREAGVTEEVVERACKAASEHEDELVHGIPWPDDWPEDEQKGTRSCMRAALLAVWPVVAEPAQPANSGRVTDALHTIKYSIQQARILGNDWKRELVLIENAVDAALAAQGQPAEPAQPTEPVAQVNEAMPRSIGTQFELIAKCPFCGCEAELRSAPNDYATNGSELGIPHIDPFFVHCDSCGCDGPVGNSEPDARSRWNGRVAQPRAVPAERVPEGWQPIETAPRDGTPVLICGSGAVERAIWGYESPWIHGWWVEGHRSDACGPDFTPTHWMRIPSAPQPGEPNITQESQSNG